MDALSAFCLRQPESLTDACAALAADDGARAFAGGTDLLVNLRHGIGAPRTLVSLSAIAGLDRIESNESGLRVGATATLRALAADRAVAARWPAVSQAAAAVAGATHRVVATVGGNLCVDTRCAFYNQSAWWRAANDHCLKHGGDTCHVAPQGKRCHAAFCGDLAPALLVHDAQVDVAAARASRRIPLVDLYVDDGRAHLALQRGELVAGIDVPSPPPGQRSGYRKLRIRGAIDFPLAGVAIALTADRDRLTSLEAALTGTNPRPFRLEGTAALVGQPVAVAAEALVRLVRRQVSPMRTTLVAADYRRQAIAAIAERLLRELAGAPAPQRTQ
ncbi:MAG TPA: 4-hydroxybenzoyl-CoA reductase subunit beta [Burkholderiaceae bacterium]|nr:4-hydroxybenzoyl-CoA reductase subunit beta [Burkholderiaceae bacterium]